MERFRVNTTSYYRGAHGHLVFYDATNIDSFKNLPQWLQKIQQYSTDCCTILVGTKSDDDCKQVDFEEAKRFADQNGLEVCETSAKTGANVEETILKLVEMCVKVHLNKKVAEGTQIIGCGGIPNNNDNNDKCILS
eukprot:TRINITY_DN1689_c0_g2_i5.p1 TRINITY_DN1689_c0_g2~~TRINITY_DN1689_c0_g2_i5.p1  ORF type:complete len:136 (-),score=26.92 TRINITY_DN1689_c0_g2_i5:13-420(-)